MPALRAYAADRLAPLGVAWQLDVGSAPCPPRPVDLVLFRVVQEAISNIARHVHARRAVITIRPEPGGIAVQVRDDGVGFDAAAMLGPDRHQSTFGLLGMQERLAAVDGTLEIQSQPGQGTRLRIFVPCRPAGEAI